MSKYNSVFVLALSVLLYSGCASIEKNNAMDAERTLAAAGFRMKTANTPEQSAQLQKLTQRKLVRHEKDGKPVWIYADTKYCNCLYTGGEKAYEEYSKLTLKKQIAEENQDAAMMGWEMWPGPLVVGKEGQEQTGFTNSLQIV